MDNPARAGCMCKFPLQALERVDGYKPATAMGPGPPAQLQAGCRTVQAVRLHPLHPLGKRSRVKIAGFHTSFHSDVLTIGKH